MLAFSVIALQNGKYTGGYSLSGLMTEEIIGFPHFEDAEEAMFALESYVAEKNEDLGFGDLVTVLDFEGGNPI